MQTLRDVLETAALTAEHALDRWHDLDGNEQSYTAERERLANALRVTARLLATARQLANMEESNHDR